MIVPDRDIALARAESPGGRYCSAFLLANFARQVRCQHLIHSPPYEFRYGQLIPVRQFSQRLDLVFRHENSGQIGMVQERDAQQVEGFPLVPLGRRPKVADGFDLRVGPVQHDFDRQGVPPRGGHQIVGKLNAVLVRPIDSRETAQEIEPEACVRLENGRDRRQMLGRDHNVRVRSVGNCGGNAAALVLLQDFYDFRPPGTAPPPSWQNGMVALLSGLRPQYGWLGIYSGSIA